MTRSILATIAVGIAVGVLSGTGCKQTGVGDPCTPEQEYEPTFAGFNEKEVNVESKSFQCQTRLCLVNHFRGRVSCPYGQTGGNPPIGAKTGCTVPSSTQAIGKDVQAQCLDRSADKAVYCSCRCENVDRKTDDGANYCKCPDGFHCAQLVTSIGAADTGLTGGYCVKDNTDFGATYCGASCSPGANGGKGNCGSTQL